MCASICPGRAFADMNIWLAVASITACFQISSNRALGDPKFTSGLVSYVTGTSREFSPSHGFVFCIPHSHPDTFECAIEPRFGNTVGLILQTSAAREI